MINKSVSRKLLLSLGMSACLFSAAVAQYKPVDSPKKQKQEKKKERINQMIKQEEEGTLIYQKQNIFGIKLNSDGYGLMYERGYMKTVNKTNLFSLDIGERKHQKEDKRNKVKTVDNFAVYGNPLIYGKINNFFFVKLGVGQSYLLGGKGNRNGVAVSAIYNGGISLGLLKPYFVDVEVVGSGEEKSIRWIENDTANNALFLDEFSLTGGSGLFKGFGKIKPKPGVFAKGAVRFDYGRYNELVSSIETGFSAEFYFSDMPIMALVPAKKLFLNVFVAIEFGKRK